jgi:hypothetical protein
MFPQGSYITDNYITGEKQFRDEYHLCHIILMRRALDCLGFTYVLESWYAE